VSSESARAASGARRFPHQGWVLGAGAGVLVGAALGLSASRPAPPHTAAIARSPAPPPAPAPAIPQVQAPAPSLAAAFSAAYPTATVETTGDDGRSHRVKFRAVALQRIAGNTFALVSAGQDVDGAFDAPTGFHAASGFASVIYLAALPRLVVLGKPFLINVTMGGWGAPPDLALFAGLGPAPTLEITGGYFDQGIGDSVATLLELGPTADKVRYVSDDIPLTHYQAPCEIGGTIVPIESGKAFEVRYSGSYKARVRYDYAGGEWSAAHPVDDLAAHCR